MSRDKLIASICNNPRDVRFTDACKVAEWLGFDGPRVKGSHTFYSRRGERVVLNFQSRRGRISTYQAKQLVGMIEKYWRRVEP